MREANQRIPSMKGKMGSRNAPMPKNCSIKSEMNAPTMPIQLRAAWVPVNTEALFRDGSSGEYEARARKRRSAETHNRKPISSLSRRLPVGAKMLARKRMWAAFLHGGKLSVAQIGQSLIIMPRSGCGGNDGIGWECTVGFRLERERETTRDTKFHEVFAVLSIPS